MRFPPLSVWETFPKSDPDHIATSGPILIIVNVIFMVLTTVAVTVRLYLRAVTKRQCGYDDYLIAVALFFALALGVNSILGNVKYGWDRHVWDLPFNLFQPASICALVGRALFTFAATCTRMSLIFFYYRLIQDTNIRWFRYVLHASMIWTVAVCITFVVLTVWICDPIESYWVFPIIPGSKCMNEGTVTLVAGIINCICDFQVTILPIPLVMRLQLPLKQRFGVIVLLSLGIIVTAAGTVRTYFIWRSLVSSWDETWYAWQLWTAACVEIDLAVLCACAPALKPLFARLALRFTNSFSTLRSRSAFTSPISLDAFPKPPTSSSTNSTPSRTGGVSTRPTKRRDSPNASLLESRFSWFDAPDEATMQSLHAAAKEGAAAEPGSGKRTFGEVVEDVNGERVELGQWMGRGLMEGRKKGVVVGVTQRGSVASSAGEGEGIGGAMSRSDV